MQLGALDSACEINNFPKHTISPCFTRQNQLVSFSLSYQSFAYRWISIKVQACLWKFQVGREALVRNCFRFKKVKRKSLSDSADIKCQSKLETRFLRPINLLFSPLLFADIKVSYLYSVSKKTSSSLREKEGKTDRKHPARFNICVRANPKLYFMWNHYFSFWIFRHLRRLFLQKNNDRRNISSRQTLQQKSKRKIEKKN